MRPSSSRPRGFTIIELMVSLSIIGLITGAMLANFRGGQQHAETRFAAEILVARLRELQTAALSGRGILVCAGGNDDRKVCEPGKAPPVTCPGGSCQKQVPAGYGLRLSLTDPTRYLVFYDTDGDGAYDAGEELGSQPYVSTGTVRFVGANVGVPVDVVFKPPFAQVYVNGVQAPPDIATFTLRHEVTEASRNVKLYRISGKIEHD